MKKILLLFLVLNTIIFSAKTNNTFLDLKDEKKENKLEQVKEHIVLKLSQGIEIKYTVYIPEKNINSSKVLVSIHGLSRNYDSHFNMNLDYAMEKEYILIVPEFGNENFNTYSTLGVIDNNNRADLALNEILQDVSRRINQNIEKINLVGYSAGAQFAHRYAMVHPEKINKLFICAPGFYTFLDENIYYPLGLKSKKYQNIDFRNKIKEFLNLEIFLYVGEKDLSREGNLKKNEFLDRTQGKTRVERAKNWYKEINNRRKEFKIYKNFKFELIQNTPHSFEKSMNNGLKDKIWSEL